MYIDCTSTDLVDLSFQSLVVHSLPINLVPSQMHLNAPQVHVRTMCPVGGVVLAWGGGVRKRTSPPRRPNYSVAAKLLIQR